MTRVGMSWYTGGAVSCILYLTGRHSVPETASVPRARWVDSSHRVLALTEMSAQTQTH